MPHTNPTYWCMFRPCGKNVGKFMLSPHTPQGIASTLTELSQTLKASNYDELVVKRNIHHSGFGGDERFVPCRCTSLRPSVFLVRRRYTRHAFVT
jgi:hypothetical protein